MQALPKIDKQTYIKFVDPITTAVDSSTTARISTISLTSTKQLHGSTTGNILCFKLQFEYWNQNRIM